MREPGKITDLRRKLEVTRDSLKRARQRNSPAVAKFVKDVMTLEDQLQFEIEQHMRKCRRAS